MNATTNISIEKNRTTKLVVYVGDTSIDAFKSFRAFEESNAPCNSCLVQAACVEMVDFGRITFTPCNEIIRYLDELGKLGVGYSPGYKRRR